MYALAWPCKSCSLGHIRAAAKSADTAYAVRSMKPTRSKLGQQLQLGSDTAVTCAAASFLSAGTSAVEQQCGTKNQQHSNHTDPPPPQQQQQQPQQQQHDGYIPADTAAGRDRQVTAHICKRRHWTQLQLIWLDNSSSLGPVHLTAIMTKLARLVEAQGVVAADRPELFKFSSAIMSSIHQTLDTLDPRGAAQCLWAYAKLQRVSPHSSRSGDAAADALAAAINQHHMPLLLPQELSQVAWAAAVLKPVGLLLPQQWWQRLQQRLLLLLPRVQPSEVACCAWAAAKTCHTPPKPYTEALLQHAADHMDAYSARELLQLLLAAAAWQYKPPATWQYRCSRQLQQLVPSMNLQDISNTLLAFARLQTAPEPELLSSLLLRLQPQLRSSSPRVLVTVTYALAKLQVNPGPSWWAGFLPYTTVSLRSFEPSALAVVAWGLARLGINPGQGWVQELLQQSGYKMQGFAAQELSMLAWALGKWGSAPSSWWWEGFEQVSAEKLEDLTAAEIGALLCGVAGMQLPPQPAAAPGAAVAVAAAAAADTVTPAAGMEMQTLSSNLLSQKQQQHQYHHHQQQQQQTVSGYYAAQLLIAAQKALAGAPADCLSGIIMGLAKLGVRPSLTWLAAFEAAAAAALPNASLGNAAALLWGFAALAVQPAGALTVAVNQRVCELLQLPLSQSNFGSNIGKPFTGNFPTSSQSPTAAAATAGFDYSHLLPQPAAASLTVQQPTPAVAVQLLWALAHLPVQIGAPWVDDLLQAVTPRLPEATHETLVTLLWAVAKLKHVPGCPGWLDQWWAAYAVQLQQQQQQQQQLGDDGRGPVCMTAVVLWSLAELGVCPASKAWLADVAAVTQPLLPHATGRQLCGLLQQLVRLRVWMGDEWLAAAAAAVTGKQQEQQQRRRRLLGVQDPAEDGAAAGELERLNKALVFLSRLGYV